VKISVVMGRNAGWLTATSALARQDSKDGPHLIYVPEVAFNVKQFTDDIKRCHSKLGRCLVAVSEGIADETGTPMAVNLAERLGHAVERDSHGNVQLSGSGALGDFLAEFVKNEVKLGGKKKLRVRADTYGYLQRSFAGYASAVDQAEARQCGRKAAQLALGGDIDGSVVMKRAKGAKYSIRYERAELKDVARVTKHMPRSFINQAGNGVTAGFVRYATPLVGDLPKIGKLF
jgi:6-phosphofructokinase 1